jgi:hypothetical protein
MKSNPNNYIKFPMNFPSGLGYSPSAAGPVGGWSYTPGPGFFGKQPMYSLLPILSGPGSTPVNGHFFGRRAFGYPLMNNPSKELNQSMFPRYPVGKGDTFGGDGGVWLQGMPNFQSYWGFGRKHSRKRSRKSLRKRKNHKNKRNKKNRRYSKIKHGNKDFISIN